MRISIAVVCLLWIFAAERPFATTCIFQTIQEAKEKAHKIFYGKVIAMEDTDRITRHGRVVVVTLEASRYYKGVIKGVFRRVEKLETERPGPNLSSWDLFQVRVGKNYIVFSDRPGWFNAVCGATKQTSLSPEEWETILRDSKSNGNRVKPPPKISQPLFRPKSPVISRGFNIHHI